MLALVIVGYFGHNLVRKKQQREQALKETAAMSQVPKELHALSLEEPQLTPKINKKCKTIENI